MNGAHVSRRWVSAVSYRRSRSPRQRVSEGRARWRYAVAGGLIGLVGGALIGAAAASTPEDPMANGDISTGSLAGTLATHRRAPRLGVRADGLGANPAAVQVTAEQRAPRAIVVRCRTLLTTMTGLPFSFRLFSISSPVNGFRPSTASNRDN